MGIHIPLANCVQKGKKSVSRFDYSSREDKEYETVPMKKKLPKYGMSSCKLIIKKSMTSIKRKTEMSTFEFLTHFIFLQLSTG